jgi:hypothetical protein
MRSPRDPLHPANLRLRIAIVACLLAGISLWIGTILGHVPAIITIPVAAVLFITAGSMSTTYRLRVRPYMRPAEYLRGILVALLLAIAIGFAALHVLPWLIQNFSAKP